MKFLRALTLICFGFGLFVQVAAQASAVPQVQTGDMVDCAEMAKSMPMKADEEPSDQTGCCENMTLGCLVVMNCVPPLSLTNAGMLDAAPPAIEPAYDPTQAYVLDSRAIVPEAPPPQIYLTV